MKTGFIPPLAWISRDGRILIVVRGVRAFAQGLVAVILALYLSSLALSLVQIGVFFSAGVAGSALFSFFVGLISEKLGRRPLLIGSALLTGAAGLALVLTENVFVLVCLAFFGSLSGASGAAATGPAQPLEQASLADTASSSRRTHLYAVYRIVANAASAIGSLAAGLPVVLEGVLGLGETGAYRFMLVGFVACMLLASVLYSMLSPAVEVGMRGGHWTNPFRLPSRRIIFTLTALFSVDDFASSLILQSLVAYWFNTRFGLELGSLAFIFFFSQILTAVSLWLAARIANRFGLINTMVFTHIPANLLLIAAAFAPGPWTAVLLWQLRSFLVQMDAPARDCYTMTVVGPEERVAMASLHAVGRSVSGTLAPSVATALWQAFSATAPLIACGAVKIAYDLSLFFMFRNVRPREELHRHSERGAAQREKARSPGDAASGLVDGS
jgi:MFS family permease